MRFAHLADCHIGAWRDIRLRELNIKSFENAIDKIIEEKLDFILISGDLFHVNIPDLESVRRIVDKIKEAKEQGINTYVVYGSHDYSPNATAIIDILTASGLLIKVMDAAMEGEKIKLNYIIDKKTGAKIAGISGRSYTLERDYYELLNRDSLEQEPGTKIFLMHSAINEIKPISAAYDTGIQASYLPKNLDYYAGGHIHEYIHEKMTDLPNIVYPGPMFGATFTDLEITAKGQKRGFVISEITETSTKVQLIPNEITKVEYYPINGDNKTSQEVASILNELIGDIDPIDKILLFRIEGVLSFGHVTDIDWNQIRNNMNEKGAHYVYINRRGLATKETPDLTVEGDSPKEIEENVFKENLSDFKIPSSFNAEIKKWAETNYTEILGLELAKKLLEILKQEKQEGETSTNYNERLRTESFLILPRKPTK